MAGQVHNPATKLRLFVHELRVITLSHWLALKMPTRPWRMRRITWPVSRGSKTIAYLESPTPICLFTIQLVLGYDDDWGSFTLELSNVKAVFGRKNSVRNWAQKWRFWGKMGVEALDFGFATPKRHFLARYHVVWRILRQNWCARLGCSLSQEPPQKIAESLCAEGREITHAQNRNP